MAVEIMAMAALAALEVELAIVQAVVLVRRIRATQAVVVVLITTVVQEVVLAQLAEAEKIARSRGTAIAIGHPHDATLEALRQWLPTLEGKRIALVPITEILRRRTAVP